MLCVKRGRGGIIVHKISSTRKHSTKTHARTYKRTHALANGGHKSSWLHGKHEDPFPLAPSPADIVVTKRHTAASAGRQPY